nr:catalase [Gammaproteobacteria bacterium]
GALFRIMSESQKQQLVNNIAGGLSHANADIQKRMLAQFKAADPDYAARVQQVLKSHEDRSS